MARKTKQETENTKISILHAALDCFYEKGFSKTSFEDIAGRIGMTKGAVYWHFKDKAELLAELIKIHIAEKCHRFVGYNAKPHNLQTLRDFFERDAQYVETHPDLQKFLFFIMDQVEWSDAIFNKVIAKLGDVRNFGVDTVQKALTSARKRGEIGTSADIKNAALVITNLWRGCLHLFVSGGYAKETGLKNNFMYGLDIILNQLKKGDRNENG